MSFGTQKDLKISPTGVLRSAIACFLSLSLPQHANGQILEQKLLLSVENVATTEGDDLANDAEIVKGMEGIVFHDNNVELFAQRARRCAVVVDLLILESMALYRDWPSSLRKGMASNCTARQFSA